MNTIGNKRAVRGKVAGYILGAIAASSYGLNPTFTLPLYASGMNPDSVLLLRYGLAIPMVAVMMLLRGCSFRISRKSIFPLIYLGILMALSSLALYFSYKYMAAGIASTLLFVYPLMVAVIMAVFCHEKLTIATAGSILLALIGIMMLYKTSEGETLSLIGTLIVMVSALSYAIYLVAINQKNLHGVASLTVTFYVLLFGTSLFLGRMLCGVAEFKLPGEWYLWLNTVALALLPTVISLVCTTRAIQLIGSTPTAILGALEPLTAVVMGMLLFHEQITGRIATGIVLILIAVSYTVLAKKDKSA